MGYLERNEPLPLDQPDRKATSFVTSHFYQDDFVQSSEDPNSRPLQARPCKRTPAEATDEDVRLARRYQGYGGTRFVKDDLAGDPGALASNGQGPLSITDRLRSTADGAQAPKAARGQNASTRLSAAAPAAPRRGTACATHSALPVEAQEAHSAVSLHCRVVAVHHVALR